MRHRLMWVVAVVLLAWHCGPKMPVNTDPATRAAFYANEAVLRLGEIQNAAIAANPGSGLSDRDAVLVVRFTVASTKTIKEVPNGWQATVAAGLTQLRTAVKAPPGTPLDVALSILQALLTKIQTGAP